MHLGNSLEVNAGIAAITCRLLEFYFLDMLTSFGRERKLSGGEKSFLPRILHECLYSGQFWKMDGLEVC